MVVKLGLSQETRDSENAAGVFADIQVETKQVVKI